MLKCSYGAWVAVLLVVVTGAISCKKDSQPVAGQQMTELKVNSLTGCYPTAINLRYADADIFPVETMLRSSYNRQFNIKHEDDHPVTAQSVNPEGDTITHKFLYDRYDNLRSVNSFKKGVVQPVDYIELEYNPGASGSFSSQIIARSYRLVAGSYEGVYTRKLLYNAQGKLLRVFLLHGVDKRGLAYQYNAAGNLTAIYQVKPDGNYADMPSYLYSDYDSATAAYANHRVWQLLAGMHSTNNPRKSTHLYRMQQNGYPNSTTASHTYQFNDFGFVTSDTYSALKNIQGQQIAFGPITKDVAAYPCIIMNPQPLPVNN